MKLRHPLLAALIYALPTAAFAQCSGIFASGNVCANSSASGALAASTTVSALFDRVYGSTRGSVLYRGASAWAALTPGTSGYAFMSNGAGADPSYQGYTAPSSSTTRTQAQVNNDTIMVSNYGVLTTNTGAQNDSAIAAMFAALGGNKNYIFAAGTYLFAACEIDPPAGSNITGAGPNATYLSCQSTTANLFHITHLAVTIRDLFMQPTGTPTTAWAVDTAGGATLLFNIGIYGHKNGIIVRDGATGFTLDGFGIRVLNTGTSLQIGHGAGANPLQLRVANGNFGIVSGAPTAHIFLNNVGDLTISKVQAVGASRNMLVSPTASNVSNVKASQLWLDSAAAGGYGLLVETSGGNTVANFTFTNSYFAGSPTANILLTAAAGTIDGFDFIGCDSFASDIGFSTTGNVKNVHWNGGRVYANTSFGMKIDSTLNFVLAGARVGSSGTGAGSGTGVNLLGSTNFILGNNSIGGNTNGLAIAGTAAGILDGNDVSGNSGTDYNNASAGAVLIGLNKGINSSRIPYSTLAQGSARSVVGVTGNATADLASIQGSAGQILGVPNAGTSLAFTAAPQLGISGTAGSLTFGNATSGLLTLQPVTGALGTPTVSIPATTDTLVGKATTDELTNKTLTASVGKGTWTASGTWTLPAFTLGGTVSGGGNQINNVVIGASTPLAGTFTTVTGTSVPTTAWNFDGSSSSVTVANGGSATLPAGAGIIILTDNSATGTTGMYLTGGNAAVLVTNTGTSFVTPTTTPAAGKFCVAWDGVSAYRIYNNQGSSITFTVAMLRSRAAN